MEISGSVVSGEKPAAPRLLPSSLITAKKAAFQADKCMRWLSDPPMKEPDTWYGKLWSKARAKVINGFLPFLKITSFIFDYVKDVFLFLYVFSKQAFIASKFIKGLISFHGLTILTSGLLMGFSIQFDNAIVNMDSFAYPKYVWLIRIVIFLATPVVPVVIILRALNLTTEKRRLEAEWRRNQESICKLHLRHSKLDKEKRKVVKALADMKMVEVSTEGVPQLFILIVLIIFSSSTESCFRLLEDDDPATNTFLVLSLLQTYMTIILATITSINIRKGGQLDLKSKIVLGLSVSCQLMARLWTMVWIAVAEILPDKILYHTNPINLTSTVVLLVLPIPIFWAFTCLLHAWLNTDFYLLSTKNTLIHLLSSMWVTVRVRQKEERDQKHKGRETVFELILAGINLMGTSAALAITIEAKFVDALLLLILPPLFLHLAGCGLLLLFEKTVRPWRDLGKERERHCWGKLQGTKRGIQAEQTIWDQVSVNC